MPSPSENNVEEGGRTRENGGRKKKEERKDKGRERRKVEHPYPSTDG